MLLTLDEEHKHHIKIIQESPHDVVCELCQVALDSLGGSGDNKGLHALNKKLGLEPEMTQEAVSGLMYLFTEAAKHNLREMDFYDSLLAMGLSEEVCKSLTEQYLSHQTHIRTVLMEMSPSLPQYHNLQWRFDVQVASRCLHHQVEPQVLLKFHTKDGSKDLITLLQTDPTNLKHLTESLEQALAEAKTAHARRIFRNI